MREHSLGNILRYARIVEHMENSLGVVSNVVKDFGKWCSHGSSLMTVIAFSQVLPKRVKRQTANLRVYKGHSARMVANGLAKLVAVVVVK